LKSNLIRRAHSYSKHEKGGNLLKIAENKAQLTIFPWLFDCHSSPLDPKVQSLEAKQVKVFDEKHGKARRRYLQHHLQRQHFQRRLQFVPGNEGRAVQSSCPHGLDGSASEEVLSEDQIN
jgi:hypothetical protein